MQWASAGVVDAWSERGVHLPVPWPTLERFVQPRGGQHVVLLAAPGVGKTAFSINWAARAGLRTLYLAADTDPAMMTEQVAALATGHPRWQVAERLRRKQTWRRAYAEAVRDRFPHLVLDFRSSPSLGSAVEQLEALTEVWGETPQLLVMDTASDMRRSSDDHQGWQEQWLAIREIARHFGLVALTNHHVKQGEAAGGKTCPSLNDGMWKPDQFAEVVLGLFSPAADQLAVGVVKNRGGRSGVVVHLPVDFAHGLVGPGEDER